MIEVVNVGTQEVEVCGVRGGVRELVVIAPGAVARFERVGLPAEIVVKRSGARVEVAHQDPA
jgi:hypothetical protein